MNQKIRNRRKIKYFYNDESGVFAVIAAILMPVILCFFALAIDVGHLMLVKSQLQNAADTAALSAADQFTPTGWSDPQSIVTVAQNTIGLNKVDGIPLTADNLVCYAGTVNDLPAIKIVINQTVHNWFGAAIGKYTSNVSATAVAVCQSCAASGTTGNPSQGSISSRRINQFLSHNSPSNQTNLRGVNWFQSPPSGPGNITLTVMSGTGHHSGWLFNLFTPSQQSPPSQPPTYVSFNVTAVSTNSYGNHYGNHPTITGYFTSGISQTPPASSGGSNSSSFKYAQLVN